MEAQPSDPEKSTGSHKDIEDIVERSVAFPGDDGHHRDDKSRPTGVEMRRQMTQEEIILAAAGYEHLTKEKTTDESTKFGDVDITEHSRPIQEIEGILGTSFNWTDPAQSSGLTAAEAEERLQRDGPNALTPPKKKSALRKVCIHTGI
jgi:sodium/potassium-transporting ATPase subunit alpha